MVDVQMAVAEFREASARRHDTSSRGVPLRQQRAWSFACAKATEHLQLESRTSTWKIRCFWEAGRREMARHHIKGSNWVCRSWYSDKSVPRDHYGGCAILFNKDTLYPDIEVKSIYLHDFRRELLDKVMEGGQVWVLLSRASFRRRPLSGQKTFTVLSPHIDNIHAKKRCIAKKLILTIRAIMIGHHTDLVAGGFNGTAWRCSNRNDISAIDEAFADCALPTPLGPTPMWSGSIPTTGLTLIGSLNRLNQVGIKGYDFMALSPSHTKL